MDDEKNKARKITILLWLLHLIAILSPQCYEFFTLFFLYYCCVGDNGVPAGMLMELKLGMAWPHGYRSLLSIIIQARKRTEIGKKSMRRWWVAAGMACWDGGTLVWYEDRKQFLRRREIRFKWGRKVCLSNFSRSVFQCSALPLHHCLRFYYMCSGEVPDFSFLSYWVVGRGMLDSMNDYSSTFWANPNPHLTERSISFFAILKAPFDFTSALKNYFFVLAMKICWNKMTSNWANCWNKIPHSSQMLVWAYFFFYSKLIMKLMQDDDNTTFVYIMIRSSFYDSI